MRHAYKNLSTNTIWEHRYYICTEKLKWLLDIVKVLHIHMANITNILISKCTKKELKYKVITNPNVLYNSVLKLRIEI
jgi:hypothetical protein